MSASPRADSPSFDDVPAPPAAGVTGDWLERAASLLPCSRPCDADEVAWRARRLCDALGLAARPRVLALDAAAAAACERTIRLRWWHEGREDVRRALHELAQRMYAEVAAADAHGALEAAWARANALAGSDAWRAQLRATARALGPAWSPYVRLLFRAAQQALSRAARWEAVFAAGSASPYWITLELLASGAWPLGGDGEVVVVVPGADPAPPRAPTLPTIARTRLATPTLFLCTELRHAAAADALCETLRRGGWRVTFGRRDEHGEPLEVQLARDVRASWAVVALEAEPDPDFGRPWWLHQEIDYAVACGVPVARVAPGAAEDDVFPSLSTFRRGAPGAIDGFGSWLAGRRRA